MKPIDGIKAIAAACSAYAGVEISEHSVKRAIYRKRDPLPARGLGSGKRKRWVVTAHNAFTAWARREYAL